MVSLERSYAKELHSNFKEYYANFPPNRRVELGDYGTVKNGIFSRIGPGATLGVTLSESQVGHPGTFQFTSAGNVGIHLGGAGAIAGGLGKANAKIEFGSSGGVFFVAAGAEVQEFADMGALRKQVLELFFADGWAPEWALVTRRVVAEALTLVVSQEPGAFIELEASGQAEISLSDPRAALGVVARSSRSIGCQFVAERATTPFVSLIRVKRRVFRHGVVVSHGGQTPLENLSGERDRMRRAGVDLAERFECGDIDGDDPFAW